MNYIETVMGLESEIRRLRKANEELVKALRGAIIKIEGEYCSHRTEHGAENDSCYAQKEYQALQSSESDK